MAFKLEQVANKVRNGHCVDGTGSWLDQSFWQMLNEAIGPIPDMTPRGKCGMRFHHADCTCDGVGGDR